jgi:hypothetical protein
VNVIKGSLACGLQEREGKGTDPCTMATVAIYVRRQISSSALALYTKYR